MLAKNQFDSVQRLENDKLLLITNYEITVFEECLTSNHKHKILANSIITDYCKLEINDKTYDKSNITVRIQNIETLNNPRFKLRSAHLENFEQLNKDLELINEPIIVKPVHFYIHVCHYNLFCYIYTYRNHVQM